MHIGATHPRRGNNKLKVSRQVLNRSDSIGNEDLRVYFFMNVTLAERRDKANMLDKLLKLRFSTKKEALFSTNKKISRKLSCQAKKKA